MVSEWMEDGNINDFIQKYSKVNRTELVHISLNLCESLTHPFSSLMLPRVWHICIAVTSSMGI